MDCKFACDLHYANLFNTMGLRTGSLHHVKSHAWSLMPRIGQGWSDKEMGGKMRTGWGNGRRNGACKHH